jgi:triphosphatase
LEPFIATETELKLAARAADLPVVQHALEKMARGSRASRSKLVSTYYDTADRKLQRDRLVLRVRAKGRQFVQTVKSAAPAGEDALTRGEWEDRIAGEKPDRNAPQSGPLLSAIAADRLDPLFTTEIVRTALDLSPFPATRIEAAIDRGTIRSTGGDAEDSISEVELELKSGEPTALYDVALRLLDVAPLRLEPVSKAQRGYRLLDGAAAPDAVHAEPFALDPAIRGDAALRRVGHVCLDQLMRNEPAALAGRPDGIHQMRVAARRLRAVVSAFAKLLPTHQRRAVSEELRWLADALGPARNFDVLQRALLSPARETLAETPGFDTLAEAAERQRRAAYAQAIEAIRSTRYTGAMLRLMRWFDASGWSNRTGSLGLHRPIAEIAPIVLDRRRRVALKRAKKFAKQSAAERHKLRIALKKLRYTSEAFESLYDPAETEDFIKRLKRLQDDLGDANDVRVGRDLVAALAQISPAGDEIMSAGRDVLDWHEQRIAQREETLREHLHDLRNATPFWHGQPAAAAA